MPRVDFGQDGEGETMELPAIQERQDARRDFRIGWNGPPAR